jgi:hypothetical protein
MIQIVIAQPTILPSSPNPLSDYIVILNNIQQFIDIIKVVVTIEIASVPPTNRLSLQVITIEYI